MRPLVALYLVLAVAGLVGTWWFNLTFFAGSPGASYLGGWFANAAASSAAVDILVTGAAASILMIVEGRRLGWPAWSLALLVVGAVAIAAAFAFPLFLALRERSLAATRQEIRP